jgi:hypothetical protein
MGAQFLRALRREQDLGWAAEARACNSLVTSWPELVKMASAPPTKKATSGDLFREES